MNCIVSPNLFPVTKVIYRLVTPETASAELIFMEPKVFDLITFENGTKRTFQIPGINRKELGLRVPVIIYYQGETSGTQAQ